MDYQPSLEMHDLGFKIAEFRPKGELLFTTLLLAALGLFCGCLGTIASVEAGWARMVALVGIMILFGAGYGAYRLYRQRGLRILVFVDGLARVSDADKPVVLRWKELKEFRQSIVQKVLISQHGFHTFLSHSFTLIGQDNQRLDLRDNLTGIETLGSILWQNTAKHMVPKAVERYQRGNVIDFGALQLSRMGIGRNDRILDWDLVEGVYATGGHITIKAKNGDRAAQWAKVKADELINLPAFLALVGDAVKLNKLKGQVNLVRTRLWFGF